MPPVVRDRIRADLERRDRAALLRAEARTEEARRAAEEEDERILAVLKAKRASDGKPPLTEKQESDIRERQRNRRILATSGGSS